MNPAAAELNRSLQERMLYPDGLAACFEHVSKSLGYALTIYDTKGFTFKDASLRASFEPYAMHTHPFCSLVKKNSHNTKRCIVNRKYSVRKAATEQRSFYGKCYMGVEEIVFPVVHGGETIAVVFLGQFGARDQKDLDWISGKAEQYQVNQEVLLDIYNNIAMKLDETIIEDLLKVILMISQFVVLAYQSTLLSSQINDTIELPVAETSLSRVQAVAKLAMERVQSTYHETFSLTTIARHCNCSTGYVSRCFSQVFGMSLVKYVNQIRVQHAKSLLGATTLSITEIALSLGFNDTNYFSKVFKSIAGTSPVAYRRRE
ncbi:helix-turn-helix domain-containing protein [Paenibacillus agaridevorans]|uniref:helix-turn-helix domain-containing protein n=1 Tax=Paenibacillus agaridevorans TaxID=171404 RepID=UPI001BE4BE1D|nr:helix-turn-helix domain-containing protein [Paenibacillus agaridevorans]